MPAIDERKNILASFLRELKSQAEYFRWYVDEWGRDPRRPRRRTRRPLPADGPGLYRDRIPLPLRPAARSRRRDWTRGR